MLAQARWASNARDIIRAMRRPAALAVPDRQTGK
jgi:hypothetical protein